MIKMLSWAYGNRKILIILIGCLLLSFSAFANAESINLQTDNTNYLLKPDTELDLMISYNLEGFTEDALIETIAFNDREVKLIPAFPFITMRSSHVFPFKLIVGKADKGQYHLKALVQTVIEGTIVKNEIEFMIEVKPSLPENYHTSDFTNVAPIIQEIKFDKHNIVLTKNDSRIVNVSFVNRGSAADFKVELQPLLSSYNSSNLVVRTTKNNVNNLRNFEEHSIQVVFESDENTLLGENAYSLSLIDRATNQEFFLGLINARVIGNYAFDIDLAHSEITINPNVSRNYHLNLIPFGFDSQEIKLITSNLAVDFELDSIILDDETVMIPFTVNSSQLIKEKTIIELTFEGKITRTAFLTININEIETPSDNPDTNGFNGLIGTGLIGLLGLNGLTLVALMVLLLVFLLILVWFEKKTHSKKTETSLKEIKEIEKETIQTNLF
ncbi:MAG: hypothetical protein ABH821_03995 [archaeon]